MRNVVLLFTMICSGSLFCQTDKNVPVKMPYVCSIKNEKLIYSETFSKDFSNWRAEFELPDSSNISLKDGKQDVLAARGATIWFKPKLSGNIMILYDVYIPYSGAKFERVSDMNVFWMASDPSTSGEVVRDGKFLSYDNLNLYYAGIGGHNNKFTRFRKYQSNGQKPVLQEYSDKQHLLAGNTEYQVKIVVHNGLVRYFLNDKLFWELIDEAPYTTGYVGFRTTNSHQQYDNFRVYSIE